MNSFLTRYSSTSPDADIRKAKELYGEDEEVSEMMWGSAGGFGNLAKGVPSFKIPAVADVRPTTRIRVYMCAACAHVAVNSLHRSCACTPTTMQTPLAVSKSSTVQRHWPSDTRAV